MAENKKSFVAYSDWKNTFEMLSDEEAGKLIKHLLSYVNDESVELEDRLLKIVFEPIKLQLKRDLKQWEDIRKKRVEAGKKGGIKSGEKRGVNEANKANASFDKQNEANEAVNVTVNVNDNVTVNDILINKKEEKFNYEKSLLLKVDNKQLVKDFVYLKKLKKASLTKTAFDTFVNECEKNNFSIEKAMLICIEKNWQGFKVQWVLNDQNKEKEKSSAQKEKEEIVIGRQTMDQVQRNFQKLMGNG